MFGKPFLLQPGIVPNAGNRKTVLDEPYTLFPDGGALLLKEFPARVRAGDPLFKRESGVVLSPVNGVASLQQSDSETRIRIVQDGVFYQSKELQPRSWKLGEALDAMDAYGLVSLDIKDRPLSSLFRKLQKPKFIVLAPFTRTQDIDYLKILKENRASHLAFLDALKVWFPESEVRDYILDLKSPIKKYMHPWGIPEYFLFKTEKLPFAEFNEVLYLGPETLHHLYRALYGDFPFIERDITLYFVEKNGTLKKANAPLRLRNGQNLKFLFDEYGSKYSAFTLNSFYDYYPVRSVKDGFFWDVRLYHSLILLANHDREKKEFPCVECGECSLNCPTRSNPMALVGYLGEFNSDYCMQCGICTFLCPSSISLRDKIREAKGEIVGN
ncbi:oxidoreductase [Leptospira perolatii]|uniref:Oxidoreductase n=1 Tax=Leptospira perolatii TaxID=2023191 RepID=A0A2M9ZSM3_9LEPT|nr:oxidoreductase [Leptospira perolatii]PJZ68733.1 oxidoreductase [Leptospira perolatii]PJZ75088.1 oxidoreductase [Leptospira perolatii]